MPRAPRTRGRTLTLLAGGMAGVAVIVGLALSARGDASRIPDGVTIGGIDVGGLSTDVARSAVRRQARAVSERPVRITTPDRPGFSVQVMPDALGARAQVDEAIDQALARDTFGNRVRGLVGADGKEDIPLRFTLDDAEVEALVERVQARLGRRPVPASVRVTGSGLRVVPGKAGLGVQEAALTSRLRTLPAEISLPVSPQPPQIDIAEAERARAEGQALLERPPTVVGPQDQRVTLRPGQMRRALQFRPRAPRIQVLLQPAALARPLRDAFGDLEVDVRDARIVPRGKDVQIIPERPGRRIDLDANAAALVSAAGGSVDLKVRTIRPKRTAAELRQLGIRRQVSQFSTPYACCQPRVTNIQRAAEMLDGTIVRPGERLSLNEVLGERTLDRGFVVAPQIAGGRFEDAVGGGVSQVATTLYNAAFFAGLEIVTHTPHEFYISRYPPGREATVSWGGPELIVRNDWPAAVYVSATATSSAITIRMYSNPLGRRVETTTGEPTDEVAPEIKTVEDPELEPGQEVVDMPLGGAGFTISYTRRVYRGREQMRDERYTWTYRPENALVRRGPLTGTGTTPDGQTAPTEPPARDDTTPQPTTGSAPPAPG